MVSLSCKTKVCRGEKSRQKVLEAVRAAEMHMALSCIAMEIIQAQQDESGTYWVHGLLKKHKLFTHKYYNKHNLKIKWYLFF